MKGEEEEEKSGVLQREKSIIFHYNDTILNFIKVY